MNKTLRYFLILLTIIAFFILAPAIIMFVSGVKINWRTQNYEQTGILVATTQPSGAEVWLNGQRQTTTPATLRFLSPGNYELWLKKEGYFDWLKSLSVEPNRIAYNYEGVDAVQLIKRPAEFTLTADKVASMVFTHNQLWYATDNQIKALKPSGDPVQQNPITLSFAPTKLNVMNDEEYLLASNNTDRKAIINTRSKTVIELPLGFTGSTDVLMAPDGSVVTLKDQAVYRFDPRQKSLTMIHKDVLGFTMLGNTGYFATASTGLSLDTRKWGNDRFGEPEILAATNLPVKPTRLIITQNKQLFALINKELYRVNDKPELVSNEVTTVYLDTQTQELTFTTPNELWFYNFLANRPQLLTRMAEKINQYAIRSSIGYGFIAKTDGLWAWEIDSRSNQNQYQLFRGPIKALAIDPTIKYLYGLSGEQIIGTTIR